MIELLNPTPPADALLVTARSLPGPPAPPPPPPPELEPSPPIKAAPPTPAIATFAVPFG